MFYLNAFSEEHIYSEMHTVALTTVINILFTILWYHIMKQYISVWYNIAKTVQYYNL